MKSIIRMMRPKHWIKNLLIFIPLFFSLNLSYNKIVTLVIGFLSFGMLASSIYIINDIFDVECDKHHPEKRKRPIASGEVSIKKATLIAFLLVIISFILNFVISKKIFNTSLYLLLSYLVLNVLYSRGLKNIPIIDIFILASGFIIRMFYGSVLIKVPVSQWLLLTTLNAAVFFGIGKRKKEINKGGVRPVLESYTENFLDKFSTISLSLTITFYSLWVMNQDNSALYISIPFIIFILMQYSLLLEKEKSGDPTTVFFKNKSLIGTSAIYVIFMIFAMYFY